MTEFCEITAHEKFNKCDADNGFQLQERSYKLGFADCHDSIIGLVVSKNMQIAEIEEQLAQIKSEFSKAKALLRDAQVSLAFTCPLEADRIEKYFDEQEKSNKEQRR